MVGSACGLLPSGGIDGWLETSDSLPLVGIPADNAVVVSIDLVGNS